MVVTIGGKDYKLFFSIAGIDFLDRTYYIEAEGVQFGFGVGLLTSQLAMGNVVGIFNAIKAGLYNKNIKDEDIEKFIMEAAEKDELDKLAEELLGELKKQPLTKKTSENLTQKIEEVAKMEKKSKATKK